MRGSIGGNGGDKSFNDLRLESRWQQGDAHPSEAWTAAAGVADGHALPVGVDGLDHWRTGGVGEVIQGGAELRRVAQARHGLAPQILEDKLLAGRIARHHHHPRQAGGGLRRWMIQSGVRLGGIEVEGVFQKLDNSVAVSVRQLRFIRAADAVIESPLLVGIPISDGQRVGGEVAGTVDVEHGVLRQREDHHAGCCTTKDQRNNQNHFGFLG